jgi:hypothetical protein
MHMLQRIDFRNPSFTHLSDLAPTGVKETPFLPGGQSHGILRDTGFRGEPRLRIGSRSYLKGIGLFARTEATWHLDGRYERFQAEVGADPHTQDGRVPGSVKVRVLVDGKERWVSPLLVAGGRPRKIAIEGLKGRTSLTILVDFGESFSIGARAVLGDPVILR